MDSGQGGRVRLGNRCRQRNPQMAACPHASTRGIDRRQIATTTNEGLIQIRKPWSGASRTASCASSNFNYALSQLAADQPTIRSSACPQKLRPMTKTFTRRIWQFIMPVMQPRELANHPWHLGHPIRTFGCQSISHSRFRQNVAGKSGIDLQFVAQMAESHAQQMHGILVLGCAP